MQKPSDRPARVAEADDILANLGDLVVGMSRLLVQLSAIEPFKDAAFGLTDWVALSVLARGLAHNNRELARVLGVTRQRANQIKTSLEDQHLISSTQSNEDARENVLMVTGAGHARLGEINPKVMAIMSASLKDRERLLPGANRSVNGLRRRLIRATRDMAGNTGLAGLEGGQGGSASGPARAGT